MSYPLEDAVEYLNYVYGITHKWVNRFAMDGWITDEIFEDVPEILLSLAKEFDDTVSFKTFLSQRFAHRLTDRVREKYGRTNGRSDEVIKRHYYQLRTVCLDDLLNSDDEPTSYEGGFDFINSRETFYAACHTNRERGIIEALSKGWTRIEIAQYYHLDSTRIDQIIVAIRSRTN